MTRRTSLRLTGSRAGPVISVSESGAVPSPYFGFSFDGCQALRSLPTSFLESALTRRDPHAVKVAGTLHVTFAFESD
jgi:hypothetical protein